MMQARKSLTNVLRRLEELGQGCSFLHSNAFELLLSLFGTLCNAYNTQTGTVSLGLSLSLGLGLSVSSLSLSLSLTHTHSFMPYIHMDNQSHHQHRHLHSHPNAISWKYTTADCGHSILPYLARNLQSPESMGFLDHFAWVW